MDASRFWRLAGADCGRARLSGTGAIGGRRTVAPSPCTADNRTACDAWGGAEHGRSRTGGFASVGSCRTYDARSRISLTIAPRSGSEASSSLLAAGCSPPFANSTRAGTLGDFARERQDHPRAAAWMMVAACSAPDRSGVRRTECRVYPACRGWSTPVNRRCGQHGIIRSLGSCITNGCSCRHQTPFSSRGAAR